MRLGRRGFLGGLAVGTLLGCRAAASSGASPERPAEVSAFGASTPAATSAVAEGATVGPAAAAVAPATEPAAPATAATTPASAAAAPATAPAAPASVADAAAAATELAVPATGLAAPATAEADDGRGLAQAVDAFLRQRRGSFGVAVHELAGPVAVEVAAGDRFALASLYKVLLMCEVARLVGEGWLRLDDSIRTAPAYGFGEPDGGVPPDTRLTVDEAVAASIAVSSNSAALALIELVTPDALRAVPARLGLGDTTVDAQPTGQPGHYWVEAFGSARDLAELFGRLGREQLVSPGLDRRMVEYLLDQRINDRLPLLLPPGTPVGHKTGEVDGLTHDGGLVLLPGRPYSIVVLAEGESPAEGRAVVAELSWLVHAHLSRGG